MSALSPTARRILAMTVLVLLSGLLAGAFPSAAHAAPSLESSTPARGGSIDAGGPVEIVLRFDESLDTDSATLVLLDDDGHQRMKAQTQVDGKTLHGLLPEVPPGDYQARYTVWGTSGQKVNGTLPFSISAPVVVYFGVEIPTWAPTALIVLFVGLAIATLLAIMAVANR